MTNETFCLLSEEEKHTKFKATMKGKTKGCLNEEELHSILMSIFTEQTVCYFSLSRWGGVFAVFCQRRTGSKEEPFLVM